LQQARDRRQLDQLPHLLGHRRLHCPTFVGFGDLLKGVHATDRIEFDTSG